MKAAAAVEDDSTRRICAALYYDQTKLHQVLDLFGLRRHSYVPSHDGVDTRLVLIHAAEAMQMWRRHNLVVVGAALTPAILIGLAVRSFSVTALLMAMLLFGSKTLDWLIELLRGSIRRDRGFLGWLRIGLLLLLGWWVGGALLFFSAISWPLLLFAFLPAVAAELVQRLWIQNNKMTQFRSDEWKSLSPTGIAGQLISDLGSPGSENATVYSGYTPFVGSGFQRSNLEQALRLELRANNGSQVPDGQYPRLSEPEITEELGSRIAGVISSSCEVRRWHFVNGLGIRGLPAMFIEGRRRPTGVVNGRQVVDGTVSDEWVRPYLWIRSKRWGGDVVLNTFVRLRPKGLTLFVELVHHVTAPLRMRYDRCDYTMDRSGMWRTVFWESVRGLASLPTMIRWDLSRSWRWDRAERDVTRSTPQDEIDYGAYYTVRDLFSSTGFRHYFQEMDEIEHRRTIDGHFATVMKEILEARGYSIADYDRFAAAVFQNFDFRNSDIKAENAAFGNNNNLNSNGGGDQTSASGGMGIGGSAGPATTGSGA